MAGLTNASAKAALDAQLNDTDKLRFYAAGSSALNASGLADKATGAWTKGTAADPYSVTNTNLIETDAASAGVTVIECAVFTTGGTQVTDLMPILPVGGASYYPFTAATTDVLTMPGNNYGSGTTGVPVLVYAPQYGSLPTGLSEHTLYYLKPSDGKLYTDSGCTSVVDITAVGAGNIIQVSPKTLAIGDTIKIAAGSLAVSIR